MCQLRGNINTTLETGWKWALSMQRMWALLQDEWPKQATNQTETKTGKFTSYIKVRRNNIKK